MFNFWEPLHFADYGYGFQTWELSPTYAIRSWAYILLHLPLAWLPTRLLQFEKVCHSVQFSRACAYQVFISDKHSLRYV